MPFHRHGNEVALVRNLLAHFWEVRIQHVVREANFCADFLAKLGITVSQPHVVLEAPLVAMLRLVLKGVPLLGLSSFLLLFSIVTNNFVVFCLMVDPTSIKI